MGKNRHDFFHMVSDQNKGWGVGPPSQPLKKMQKIFPRSGVQTCARFIEYEKFWFGHEGAAYKDALSLPLGKHTPRSVCKVGAFHLFKKLMGMPLVSQGKPTPEMNHGLFTTGHSVKGGFLISHHLPDGGTDETHFFAQVAPIRLTIGGIQEAHIPGRRHEIACESAEQGSFSRAIGPEEDPMLAAPNLP